MGETNGELGELKNILPEGMGSVVEIKKKVEDLKVQAQEGFKLAKIGGGALLTGGAIAAGLELAASQSHSLGIAILAMTLATGSLVSGIIAGGEYFGAVRNDGRAKSIGDMLAVALAVNKGKN